MSNLKFVLGLIIGIFGFLFLFWRRLKENYSSNQIFSFGYVIVGFILLGFLVGIVISHSIVISQYHSIFSTSGLWFWSGFIFLCIGFKVAIQQFKLHFFETLEATVLGFIFLIFSLSFSKSLLFSVILAILIALFYFLDSKYRTFSWYKSGKIGFSGLTIMAIFFLVRAVVALINPNMVSFDGKIDAVIDSVVSFIFFLTLYNLSEK